MHTILIAEDEAHILRVMSMWLNRHGYRVLEAGNGVEALELLDRENVDLIISDMNMPEMDGLAVIEAIRSERDLDIPILLLTARCDQGSLAEKLRPYDVRIYPKPFIPSRLVSEIDILLKSGGPELRSGAACGDNHDVH